MKAKNFLLFLLLIGFSAFTYAAEVDREAGQQVAENYLQAKITEFRVDYAGPVIVDGAWTKTIDGNPIYHIYNFENGGYVIVSAEDNTYPILGYSYKSQFSNEGMPDNIASWMKNYADQIIATRDMELEATEEIQDQWNTYMAPDHNNLTETMAAVEPLLASTWNQDWPYNAYCPEANGGPGGHVYVGCVATTMAQIMYYFRYPEHGYGEKSYNTPYGEVSADFENTYYQWDNMVNDLGSTDHSAISAVAELNFHCAVAVTMDFGINGSGSQTIKIPYALKTYFGYSNDADYEQRAQHNDPQWINMLTENLDEAKPLAYSGYPSGGGAGHCFVFDGYQTSGDETQFHVNWGWSGSWDGYFNINSLNPGGSNFNQGQQAIFDIYPGEGYPQGCGDYEINHSIGTIVDGSGILEYENNQDCTYLIAPPEDSVASIDVDFFKFDLEANDQVTIYDGATMDDPVLATFTGSDQPEEVTSSGDRVLIHFETDGSGTAQGWGIDYEGELPDYCNGTAQLTAVQGNFDDNSGDYRYSPHSLCRWLIQPQGATSMELSFSEFNLPDDDDMITIKGLESNETLAEFTGTEIPDMLEINENGIFVIFSSDFEVNGGGFAAYYEGNNVGVEETSAVQSINLYPNPVENSLNLKFSVNEPQSVDIKLMDITGKVVYDEELSSFSGDYHNSIDVSTFAKGVYLFTVRSEKANINKKVVIK
ncbi:MAG: C10 family peptidase [Bacteroidales bacterium]|nr:C10 family peptidase [Bacteroidales bacterium]